MDDKILKSIDKKLLILIGVFDELRELLANEKSTEQIKVKRFVELGLTNDEVAVLLQKPTKRISDLLYKAKNKVKKKDDQKKTY